MLTETLFTLLGVGAPALEGPQGLLSRLALLYYQLGGILPERVGLALLCSTLVAQVMSAVLSSSRDPAVRRWTVAEHLRYFNVFADRQMVLEAFAASVGDDVSAYAEQITIPVPLLVGGQRDDITPAGVQERLASRFPDAILVMIPEVGHLMHYEAPKSAGHALRPARPAGRDQPLHNRHRDRPGRAAPGHHADQRPRIAGSAARPAVRAGQRPDQNRRAVGSPGGQPAAA